MEISDEVKKLIDGVINILLDVYDHRSESFPYFCSKILKVFGHEVSEEAIELYLKEEVEYTGD